VRKIWEGSSTRSRGWQRKERRKDMITREERNTGNRGREMAYGEGDRIGGEGARGRKQEGKGEGRKVRHKE